MTAGFTLLRNITPLGRKKRQKDYGLKTTKESKKNYKFNDASNSVDAVNTWTIQNFKRKVVNLCIITSL